MNEQASEQTAVSGGEAVSAAVNNKPVLVGRHHDLTAFASSDDTRYVIISVHYNAREGCMEATDGSILARVPVSSELVAEFPAFKAGDEGLSDCIIPLAPFKRALANIPKGGVLPVLNYARLSNAPGAKEGEVGKVTLVTTDLETEQAVSAKALEGRYPDCNVVIPASEPTLTIALGSKLLRKIADYAERHGKETDSKGGVAIMFRFVDELTPVRFSLPLEVNPTQCMTGVISPMRVS